MSICFEVSSSVQACLLAIACRSAGKLQQIVKGPQLGLYDYRLQAGYTRRAHMYICARFDHRMPEHVCTHDSLLPWEKGIMSAEEALGLRPAKVSSWRSKLCFD